jgi:hypothetical protein
MIVFGSCNPFSNLYKISCPYPPRILPFLSRLCRRFWKYPTDVTHCANRREIVPSVVVVPTYGTLNLTPIRNNPCYSCPVTTVRIMRIALVRMAMHYNSFYFGDLKRFCNLIYDLSQFSLTFSFNLNLQAF